MQWTKLSGKNASLVKQLPVLLGGLERFLRLLHTAKMTKTQIRMRKITAKRTPEMIPIF